MPYKLLASVTILALKYQRMPQCHIWGLIYLLSLIMGLVDLDTDLGQPWLHELDPTIPSLIVTSVWLLITPVTSNVHCSNQTSSFWVESLLNMLNFDVFPTAWEASMEQAISCGGSESCLCNCMFTLSTDIISSLPTQLNRSPMTPAWVWQCHIQYLHCNPATSE